MIEEPERRLSVSAPPILTTYMDSKHDEVTQMATWPTEMVPEAILGQLQSTPYLDTYQLPRSITSCAKNKSPESDLLLCGRGKDKLWLSDVYTRIESLSRAMEQEKSQQKQFTGSNNLLGLSTSKQNKKAWLMKHQQAKTYQDWRGIIISETTDPYTMLSHKEHQERLKRITKRQRSKGMLLLQSSKLERHPQEFKKDGDKRHDRKHGPSLISEKVKRIGPHLEIFEAFNQMRKVHTKDQAVSAATCIQRIVRGWLDRTRLNRLRIKAKSHGPTLLAVVREYRKMMYRIKRRCGIVDPTTPLIFDQLEDWLDQKKFYETMFAKREFLKEMDKNELPKFFRDCGRFPSTSELNNTMKLVLEGSDSKITSINKTQAVEMAFMLYPPRGLKLATAAVARSTWLKPIVDGEDGYRYLTSAHPVLKAADIRVAGAVVAASIRERKRKEREVNRSPFSVDSD
ncbi:hypothetical protein JRQ81_016657 [Phrynocephalus forsythii]|uniref:Uncharacterized protein n=1 Tax=Phrynocephalus forsythii TaxID=171643 RepID=A0A9Q0XTK9_9SAUR|nr:hypothetical protein JRQ81_016657 [Phrynocephalus forsythii]